MAICPIKVESPVAKTMPFPVPSLFKVEKNAIFFVYSGLSSLHSGVLSSNYVYPVSEELSTFISCESTILKSAGNFLPS